MLKYLRVRYFLLTIILGLAILFSIFFSFKDPATFKFLVVLILMLVLIEIFLVVMLIRYNKNYKKNMEKETDLLKKRL